MPTPLRTARHSRATAACMLSPASGKYQGRFQLPTSSNAAPWDTCHSCMQVLRMGSKKSPSSRPATAPKVTGV
ncbi:hypothetical protein D3C73_1419710 [compost metagenome]